VSCVAAGAARTAAAAVVQGWRRAVAGVAGALQVGQRPGKHTMASESVIAVMD